MALILSPTFKLLLFHSQSRDVLLANVVTIKRPLFCRSIRFSHCDVTAFFATMVSLILRCLNLSPLIWLIWSATYREIGSVDNFIFSLSLLLLGGLEYLVHGDDVTSRSTSKMADVISFSLHPELAG